MTLPATDCALTDEYVMDRVQAGCEDAVGELYDRYGRASLRLARSICRDHGQADEAVQDAFLSIWHSATTYRPRRGPVSTWVLSVVRYRAIDALRRNAKHVANTVAVGWLDERFPAPDDVFDTVSDHVRTERVRERLAGLPETQREAIVLAYYCQLAHTEIAELLGVPLGTVKGRIRLGLQKLQPVLGREHYGPVAVTPCDPELNAVSGLRAARVGGRPWI